ncbi:MAG TPA: AsmA family protein [Gammaproteobacteria bacterium]|nr:AsmA family protein [Gammaproteobacteria bacterium]
MKKALKIIGIVIGVIIVLIIAAVLIIPQVIDPNDYRDDIEAAVARNTDRTLTIKGNIELSLFPWLGVTVGKATLSNAPGFGPEPFATIDNMEVRVRLLSLLGDPEVGTLKLQGLELNLARNAKGETNWQDLLAAAQSKQAAGKEPEQGRLGNLTVDSIELRGATINWRDAMTDKHYRVRDANVTIGKVQAGEPFPLKMDFAVDRVKPVLHANVGIKATATLYPAAKQYNLVDGMIEIAARGANLPAQPTHLKANWQSLQLDQGAGTFQLKDLKLNALGVQAHAVLQGSGLNAQPEIKGILVVPDFSPRDVLARMGRAVKPEDSTVLRHASLSADITATRGSAALNNLKATLDDTHLTGRVAMPNFETHALAFTLTADHFDADRYLPAGKEQAAKQAPIGALDSIRLPGNRLRGLNLHGRLAIDTLKLLDMTANDVTLGIDAANGTVHLKPLTAALYGGTYTGQLTAAAAGEGLKLSANQQLANIHFAPLLQDLLGKKLLSGTASMKIAFDGQGDTVGALKKTLNGEVGFKVQDGAVEGVDLWSAIDRAYAVMNKQEPPKQTGPERTEFVALSGSGAIKDGVLHNKDFQARLPFMRLSGHGTIDLVQRDVEYKLEAKIVEVPDIKARGELEKLKGHTIPVVIQGDFSSLEAFPALRDVFESRLKDEAKSRVEEKKDELQDKLQDKLKGLFNSGGDDGS